MIAAVSTNAVIGIGDEIPWYIPEDFKHFKNTTMGNMLLVGATTIKTLPKKAHVGREFIVLNSGKRLDLPERNYYQFSKLDTILSLLHHPNVVLDRVYVIGGASVYDALIDYCDEAVITWVNKIYENGDKMFPIDNLFANFDEVSNEGWKESKTGISYNITYNSRKNGSPKKIDY